jgi:pimeloyl-ACP methyl ester carboxylesterase
MKLKRQTKEIIQIVLFFLIGGALVFFYMVYPLNRTKALMGRINLDEYEKRTDSLIANSDSIWIAAGLSPDTFRVETDGLTSIAGLICVPKDAAIGTVILLHGDGENRDSLLPLALAFLSSNYSVVACDQRASGRSSGEYHGDGWYEGNDLNEVIAYQDLRNRLIHPVTVVGFGVGGDAAILSSLNENRIDAVAAMDPYLSSSRWLNILKERNETWWFPFFRMVMWWYYDLRSSYAAQYRELDDIQAVKVPTMLFVEQARLNDPEVLRLKELSSDTLLTIHPTPTDESGRLDRVLEFVTKR